MKMELTTNFPMEIIRILPKAAIVCKIPKRDNIDDMHCICGICRDAFDISKISARREFLLG